jgi:hypothetical protein
MYAEEYLPDDAVFDNDGMDVSIDETSSMDSEERERKTHVALYRQSDPDYYSFKRLETDEDGSRHVERVHVWSTPIIGWIRSASTGVRESHRVGSKYEDLYFRVKDCALYTKTELNKEPRKLFYHNPEEYERHMGTTVSTVIKKAWYEKYMHAKAVLAA